MLYTIDVRVCVRVTHITFFILGEVLNNFDSLLQGDRGLNGTKGEKGIDGRSGFPGPKVSIST